MVDHLVNVVVIDKEEPGKVKINKYTVSQVGKRTPEISKKTQDIFNEWGNFEFTFVLKPRKEIKEMDPIQLAKTSCVLIETGGLSVNKDYSKEVLKTYDRLCQKIKLSRSREKNKNLQGQYGFHTALIFESRQESKKIDSKEEKWVNEVRKISYQNVEFASKLDVKRLYRKGEGNLKMFLERLSMEMANIRSFMF